MPIKRLTIVSALVSVVMLSAPLSASPLHANALAHTTAVASDNTFSLPAAPFASSLLLKQPAAARVPELASRHWIPATGVPAPGFLLSGQSAMAAAPAVIRASSTAQNETLPAASGAEQITDLRKALIAMAMNLRDTRYVRGGRDPAVGFDCSGFVRYVFAHAVGMKLPTNSASQFLAGLKVKRADMKPGDLVFFHTSGKNRISHVGIYISNNRFIHSPASGKSVQVSSLTESYWAKRFAGAKRPQPMAMAIAAHNG